LVDAEAPQLLAEPGIGYITAAQCLIAWSHPRRCRSEAAFVRLGGNAPIEAPSRQTVRHRLNGGGDRHPNEALQVIAMTHMRPCDETRTYVARRLAQGRNKREIRRCLKRHLLGHASIRTTSDRYGHLYDAARERLRDHVDKSHAQ
jgi:transposase